MELPAQVQNVNTGGIQRSVTLSPLSLEAAAYCQNARKLDCFLLDQPDENAPERPPSAYVIFSNRKRPQLFSG